jgi:hypothetical protein
MANHVCVCAASTIVAACVREPEGASAIRDPAPLSPSSVHSPSRRGGQAPCPRPAADLNNNTTGSTFVAASSRGCPPGETHVVVRVVARTAYDMLCYVVRPLRVQVRAAGLRPVDLRETDMMSAQRPRGPTSSCSCAAATWAVGRERVARPRGYAIACSCHASVSARARGAVPPRPESPVADV